MNSSLSSKSSDRCAFTKSHGHRCRMLPIDGSPYCLAHQPKPDSSPTGDHLTAAELAESAGTLSTPQEIHNFLTKVTLLRIQGRISPKEAGVYSYLGQNLHRGLREIAFHRELQSKLEKLERPYVNNWNIPRPDRSDPPSPST